VQYQGQPIQAPLAKRAGAGSVHFVCGFAPLSQAFEHPGNIMIRAANNADATIIAEIYNFYISNTIITFEKETVSPGEIASRIADVLGASLPWLVMENDQGVFGFAYATKWRARPAYKHSVETTIYLSNAYAGKGFGRLLYAKLLSELTSAGFHTAIAGIALPNDASVKLHESLGFRKVAHFQEVGNKFDRWIDVGFWQVML
jgi:L-amino acid N-acyltransferase YncA